VKLQALGQLFDARLECHGEPEEWRVRVGPLLTSVASLVGLGAQVREASHWELRTLRRAGFDASGYGRPATRAAT
jgi:hypothetical protein